MKLQLTEQNGDDFEKFGDCKNIIYDLIIKDNLKYIKKKSRTLLNQENNQGYTPLHWAIITHRHEIFDYIISDNMQNLFAENFFGDNCFSLASRFNNTYAFGKLIQKFPKTNYINIPNQRGFNSLIFAAANKNTEIINFILKISSLDNLRMKNIYDANFLHWLFHGKDIPDINKFNYTKKLLKLIKHKIPSKDLNTMLFEKNAIEYTPISWLEHYNNLLTLKYIQGVF